MSDAEGVHTLLQEAAEAFEARRWSKAIDAAQEAAARDPANIEACILLGRAYFESRRYDGAYSAFKRALQIDPENVEACTQLYNVCMKLKDFHAATVLLEQLVRLDPDNRDHARNLKELYFRTGQTQQALAIARDLSESTPGGTDAAQCADEPPPAVEPADTKALVNSIYSAISIKDWKEAERRCEAALALDPENLRVLSLRAYIHFYQARFSEAAEECKAILRKRPNTLFAEQYLGLALLKLKQWEEGGRVLERLATLDAKEFEGIRFGLRKEEVLANLGLTYEKRNLVRTAQLTYEQLLKGKVDFPAVRERLKKIKAPLGKERHAPPAAAPAAPAAPEPQPQPASRAAAGRTPEEPAPPAAGQEQPAAPPPALRAAPEGERYKPCLACQKRIPAKAEFCPHCGEIQRKAKRCVHCAAELPPDAQFCGRCGRGQQAARFVCLHCFARSEGESRFCAGCGALLIQSGPDAAEVLPYFEACEESLRAGRLDEAVESMRKAVVQAPRNASARLALAVLNEQNHKPGEAEAQYRDILAMETDYLILVETCCRLAILLIFALRRPSEALVPLEQGARLAPDDPTFHYVMGLAYLRIGENEKALREFNRIVELDSWSPLAFASLGNVYARNNQGEQAGMHYNRAVSLLRWSWSRRELEGAQAADIDRMIAE